MNELAVRIMRDHRIDFAFGSFPSILIFSGSAIFGLFLFILHLRAPRDRSIKGTSLDFCATLVMIGALGVGLLRWLELTLVGSVFPSDFTQDYVAAMALRRGVSLYGESISTLGRQTLYFAAMNQQPTIANFHPPFNAIAFLPISYMPYSQAFISWNILCTLAYIFLIYTLIQVYGLNTFRCLQLSTILLIWEPFTSHIALGQISIVLALLIVGGFFLLERAHKERMAGALFGLAAIIKLFPGFILLYLLLHRHFRCAFTMGLTIAGGILLTLLIVGAEDIRFYISNTLPHHVNLYGAFPFNISVKGVVLTIFDHSQYSVPAVMAPWIVESVTYLINGVIVAMVIFLGRCTDKSNGAENLFALTCLTMLLVSPITWAHTCIIILLPVAILLREGLIVGHQGALFIAIAVLLSFSAERALVRDAVGSYPPGKVPWYVLMSVKHAFFGLVILWGTFCWKLAGFRYRFFGQDRARRLIYK